MCRLLSSANPMQWFVSSHPKWSFNKIDFFLKIPFF
jgi:hypothetical protein